MFKRRLGDRDDDVQVLARLDLPLGHLLTGCPPDVRLGLDGADELFQPEQPSRSTADPRVHREEEAVNRCIPPYRQHQVTQGNYIAQNSARWR